MSAAIDGLISGIDTTSMITQLMTLEALPQTALKTKVSTTGTFVTALQSLNTKVSSLGDSATKASSATSWGAVTSASSATSVTSSASATASAGSLTFQVDAIATRQTSVSAAVTDLTGFFGGVTPATLTLATGSPASPTVAEISMTGVTDLASLATAINDADAGVTATLVKISATESRLQLSSKSTGVAGAFDLYSGSVAAADVAAATPLMGRAPAFAITNAADAQITLWKGTGVEQIVTSATNTFAGVLTGVDFTISKVEADPVTLTVKRDNAALTALASGLVTNLSTVLAEITSRTKSSTTTDSTGRTLVTGGIFTADNSVRTLKQSLLTAASAPVDGISPSSMGIVLGKDGTFTFDATIFSAALAADPAKVQSVISGMAARVAELADDQSDPIVGALSLKITSQQSYVKGLGDQVLGWDNRLELRRAALEKSYAGLEVALGKLNSQSDWLTSQLTSLTGSNNS
ncbi:flagellar filament capping protein FliD [Pengzhenrongella frigida]|uniref:Flagellar hook-associated protein 2 n=1 Tax=Pengzhenrongella frigida TaxID=1259133 RepID=A0A4Q5MWR3_9MICO|nr:flagellar filament capping protein FliD [Cellulomonas sp. HLT2-17]RYV50029.1 flagellar cap protein [Cellulomonas sp. HLT2-17]